MTLMATSTPQSAEEKIDSVIVDETCTSKDCVKKMIRYYADMYGVDRDVALKVASCESNFRYNVVGDGGKAYGVFQFHEPTFREFAESFGNERLEYRNMAHGVELAMWALANGKGAHWTCYRKIRSQAISAKIANELQGETPINIVPADTKSDSTPAVMAK
jgi:hypothetical protein